MLGTRTSVVQEKRHVHTRVASATGGRRPHAQGYAIRGLPRVGERLVRSAGIVETRRDPARRIPVRCSWRRPSP